VACDKKKHELQHMTAREEGTRTGKKLGRQAPRHRCNIRQWPLTLITSRNPPTELQKSGVNGQP
jgi:hypothetical protein